MLLVLGCMPQTILSTYQKPHCSIFAGYQIPSVNLSPDNGWGQVNTQVLGPSASLSLGKHALGLHTSVRASASLSKLPLEYAQLLIQGGGCRRLNSTIRKQYTYQNANVGEKLGLRMEEYCISLTSTFSLER